MEIERGLRMAEDDKWGSKKNVQDKVVHGEHRQAFNTAAEVAR